MSIVIHCQSCKKRIKAPDTAGGKWGKCPFCEHRNYIPSPPEPEEEELKLAPIDESHETQYGSLMKETYDLTKNILHETQIPEDDDEFDAQVEINERDVLKNIIFYLRYMAEGKLEKAQPIASGLLEHKTKAQDLLQRMLRSSPEPDLADIPPRLLQGFIKALLNQLK